MFTSFNCCFQAHKQHSTEIGYLLSYYNVQKIRGGRDWRSYRAMSGIRRLLEEQNPRKTLQEFMMGPNSLGAFIENQVGRYRAIPSETLPETESMY